MGDGFTCFVMFTPLVQVQKSGVHSLVLAEVARTTDIVPPFKEFTVSLESH
jgi:hypothetical protein